MTLLQQFVDSELIRGLTTGDKAMASLYITIVGMSITFAALCILWGSGSLLSVIFKPKTKKQAGFKESRKATSAVTEKMETNDGELIAIIAAAIAAAEEAPLHSFKVKSIIQTVDRTPQWGKVGRIEQLTQLNKR